MTQREIDIILDAVTDLKKDVGDMRKDFNERLEALESAEDRRAGRNSFLKDAAKGIAGLIAAVLALLGIKSQTGL